MADQLEQLRKSIVIDDAGSRIGGVGRIYLDDATGQVTFVTAKAGLFGQREVLVPVAGALVGDGLVEVPFSSDLVRRAPTVPDDYRLTPEQEAEILRHFGLPFILPTSGTLN
ncbi:PRC-barrel domain-containing protein [Brooklawnia sp.]|uniref:PRC-barrel domain-containing protein n=1 Tax=Brooklawnia sp. TaxID=2699740 RepID=UPI0031200D65